MAPQKRARDHDDDEDDIIAVESASSRLRQDINHKKQRVSLNRSASKSRNARGPSPDESSDDSSEDEELPDADANENAPPAATQYEQWRDNNFEHVAHPDLDDAKMTQQVLRSQKNRKVGDNRPADNATIEEITCINFMCHDRLHVELGPLINFIVGHNGSGKSAVLTAITLCLGGKVAATNRGSSLKSMIKSGKDQAMLIIKLKNKGHDAYQPDTYGESIIIERHFSKSGSSNWKLKSATGRPISTKKGDIDDIVEYFNLQVDNPMNVLTQDAAKSFIQTSTPAQKYMFFHKGVQLEALDHDFQLLAETCGQIEEKLEAAKADVLALKKKSEAAEAKLEVLRQHEGMKLKLKELMRKLAWAQVFELEEKLRQREEEVADYEQQLKNAQRKIEEKSEAFEIADRAFEHAKETATALRAELEPLQDSQDAAKSAYNSAKKNVEEFVTSLGGYKTAVKDAQIKVKSFQDSITKEQKLLEEANGGAHAQKLAELADAEQAAVNARATQSRNEQESRQLEQNRQNAQDAARKIEAPLMAKRNEIKEAQERLQSLNRDRGNVWAGFDRNMPKLIKMIKEDRGFLETPVGPMGAHIRLKNSQWSDLLESQMASNLTGFIVTSKPDQVRLTKLLRQERMEFCPVIIGNHHPIDITGNEPDEQFETILRALEIDNELVKRHLIISMGIEQSILVKKREDALKIMFEGSRPKNVRQCFCLHDSQRGWGHRLGFAGRSGVNRDMTPVNPPINKPRMKTDIESRAVYQRETVNQLEAEVKALESEKRQLQANKQKCETAVGRNKQDADRFKIAVQRADDKVENLKIEVEKYQLEDGAIDGHRENLREAEVDLGIAQEAYGNISLQREPLNNVAFEKKRELDAAKKVVEEHEAKINKAREKIGQRERARNSVLVEKNHVIGEIEELRTKEEATSRKREELVEKVAGFIEEAKKVCAERVHLEPGESYDKLGPQFDMLKKRVKEAAKRQGGSDKDIMEAALEADRIWQHARDERGELLELLGLLKQTLFKRMAMYRNFQSGISARSRINFNYLLSERGFRGKLLIDHVHKKLDVQVEPDETVKSSKGRQTKTLSGGEKSFSSICLLLALWEAMGAPIRCLDEFDVFMDDVNRDVSTRLIIQGARRSVGRQFILISPKALGSGAADAPDVKITKLHDPREKQRRIDEMIQDE
ncbi:related to DNA repair protein rad18 [Phialocephala subalpina]|uniref:Related to DNA repair protein rad18 n=1 Tax=Phialocephala subalpina TaxID=576137 RepID=A0A1L7WXD5_9HELO|nr:related to DNA repair protein rad18 [Phialocephala subalpina]